jgi:hypothetical protein
MLLVMAIIAPTTARASCGHDVKSQPIRSARESLADLELLKYSDAEHANSAPAVPRPESPCSGSSCSRGHGLPATPVISFLVRMSDSCCCTAGSSRRDDPDSVIKPVELSMMYPRYHTSRVERPPRILLPLSHF